MIKILSGVLRPGRRDAPGHAASQVDFRSPHGRPRARRRHGLPGADADAVDDGRGEPLPRARSRRARRGLIRRRELAARADDVFARLGISGIDPRRACRQRSRSRSARSSRSRARCSASPTSSSSTSRPPRSPSKRSSGCSGSFATCASAASAVIFTSHRWSEVANLADRITVFRNGEHVATRDRARPRAEAVTLMTGRTIDRMYPDRPPLDPDDATPCSRCSDLRGDARQPVCRSSLRRGEILGIGGLAGQGQRDLFMTLFGARKASRRRDPDRRHGPPHPQAG